MIFGRKYICPENRTEPESLTFIPGDKTVFNITTYV